MTFAIHSPEQAWVRRGAFGVELLDAVTMEPVSRGVRVVAEGLPGEAFPNSGGVFVWIGGDPTQLEKITIEPGALPYERVELQRAQLQFPVTTVELPPRVDYPFGAGVTGLRAALIEETAVPPQPVRDAVVHLQWLDDDGVWRDSPATSGTNTRGGDFVAILRLAPDDVPRLTAGEVTVRLRVRRGATERGSPDRKVPDGRIAAALPFAWDELLP